MDHTMGILMIGAACLLVLLVAAMRSKTQIFLNFILRAVLGLLLIYFVNSFLDGRGIARAAILGFSDGGNIALLFALRYPSCVEKLIVNGANLYPSGMKTGVWLATELEYEFLRLLSVFSPGAAKKRDLFRLMAREPHIRWESLQKIAVPALVIAGTDDMIKESHTRRMAAALPRGELALIEGSHFVARENSREFNRAVRKFLES